MMDAPSQGQIDRVGVGLGGAGGIDKAEVVSQPIQMALNDVASALDRVEQMRVELSHRLERVLSPPRPTREDEPIGRDDYGESPQVHELCALARQANAIVDQLADMRDRCEA